MSHLRRAIVLIMLALLGWCGVFNVADAVSASASVTAAGPPASAHNYCC